MPQLAGKKPRKRGWVANSWRFRLVFQRIRANPDAYPVTYRGTRRALIRRFPYGVIFVPLAQQDCIVVLAVLHCGRDPTLWRQRSRI